MKHTLNYLQLMAAAALLLAAMTGGVSAQQPQSTAAFSYSFFEASYLRRTSGLDVTLVDGGLPTEVDAGPGNGFFVRGSIEVEDGVYLFAAYEREESDYDIQASLAGDTVRGEFDVRFQAARAGIGYVVNLRQSLDLYVQAGLSVGEFKAGTGSVVPSGGGAAIPVDFSDESQSGVSGTVEIGLRTRIGGALELDGALNWHGARKLELADADSLSLTGKIGARAAARFLVNDTFSIGAEYQKASADRLLVSVRVRF